MSGRMVHDGREPTPRVRAVGPAGARWGIAVALLVGAVVAAGLLCVDDRFSRRHRACDLRGDASCIDDPASVEPSEVGLLRWRAGADLELSLGPVEPGDVVKLKLCSPEGSQRVELAVDGAPVADLAVGTAWRQHEVVSPSGGLRMRLRRRDSPGHGVDISRLSVANTLGHASGVFELAVRSRLAPTGARRISPRSLGLVLAIPPLLAALLLGGDRRRGRAWPAACRSTAEALAPSAALLALAAGFSLVSPWVLTFPGRTYPPLVLLPSIAVVAVRERRAAAASLRRVASLPAWRRLPTLAAAVVRPDRWSPTAARATAAVAIVLFVLVALLLLPRSPFEWDEVLFLRAMDRYDVAEHSPHPPGYPLYVASAHAVDALVADPARSLQLASVAGAVLALLGVGLALRRLAAPRGSVAVACALLATVPAFAFHANVGMSDALATGLATLALWACAATVAAPPGSWWPVPAAALAALALGTRPQVGAMLLGPGLWVVALAARSRSWRPLAAATATGLSLSAACWVPAVALTGGSRYLSAIEDNMRWIARNEVLGHLPGAPLGRVLDAWLVQPFGSAALAVPFWLLVIVGAFGWWRSEHRGLAALAASGAGGYLIAAAFRLQLDASVRYVLPALPCLAMLAAGVVTLRSSIARCGLTATAGVLALLQVTWAMPAHLLRAREVAPVWSTLSWVRAHLDPATTQVVVATVVRVHAQYLLDPCGATWLEENQAGVPGLPGPLLWRVGPLRSLDGERLVHREAWRSDRLRRLTRDRYLDCGVAQRGEPPPALVGEPLPTGPWRLLATRTLRLAPSSRLCTVRVSPSRGSVEIRRGGQPLLAVPAGSTAELPLTSGESGSLQLVPLGHEATLTAELLPSDDAPPLGSDRLIPSVAHAVGARGELWASDLELVNTAVAPVSCRLALLHSDPDRHPPLQALLPLPPGDALRLRDVVPLLFGTTGTGAIVVEAGTAEVRIRSTMHRTATVGESHPVDVPMASPSDLLDLRRPGEVALVAPGRADPSRVNLGVLNLADVPAVVAVKLSGGARRGTGPRRVQVAPRSYRVVGLGAVDGAARLGLTVETAGARILAHASVVEEGSGRWAFVPVSPASAQR